MAERPLETFLTLILEDADAELAQAHRELYPERIPEQIPLSLTLLYPWIPAESMTDTDLERLRAFFASRPQLEFELTRLAEFPGKVVYAVPEPDDNLRATMRALWAVSGASPVRRGGRRSAAALHPRALGGRLRDHVRAGRRACGATASGVVHGCGGHADGGARNRPLSRP
jgi:hypothetical protein